MTTRPNATRWCFLLAAAAAFAIGCGGSTASGGAGGSGGVGASGGSGGFSLGGACSNWADCGPGRLCDFYPNDCGQSGKPGKCGPAGTGPLCTPDEVCGCDGHVYANTCDASNAGVDQSDVGGCATPAGQVPCGDTFCDPTTSFCSVFKGAGSSSYSCTPLPASCHGVADCACLTGFSCGTDCKVVSQGGLDMVMVTCSG